MKNLIFVDNDLPKNAAEDLDMIKDALEAFAGFPQEQLDRITTIANFNTVPHADTKKLIFDPNNCILTFSMYTHHYISYNQLVGLLTSAGINEVSNCTYVDVSGKIKNILRSDLKEWKGALAAMNAIETNYIITRNEDMEFCRLRISLTGYFDTPFRLEEFDLLKHIG
jgi:hypothetical protein